MRTSQGAGVDATGGDFRFQGQWLESATGIYHFRARDYDARTGTFLSRDPVDPTEQQPEAMNPYQFTYNNPYIYSDPSGRITIGELSARNVIESILQAARTQGANQIRKEFISKARGIATDIVTSTLRSLLPFNPTAGIEALNDQYLTGDGFAGLVEGAVCSVIGKNYQQFFDNLWFEASVSADGEPTDDGYHCGEVPEKGKLNVSTTSGKWDNRPDLIIKRGGPASSKRNPPAYLISEFKRSVNEAWNKKDQLDSFARYAGLKAQRHTYNPVVLYVTLFGEEKAGQENKIKERALQQGALVRVISFFDKRK